MDTKLNLKLTFFFYLHLGTNSAVNLERITVKVANNWLSSKNLTIPTLFKVPPIVSLMTIIRFG